MAVSWHRSGDLTEGKGLFLSRRKKKKCRRGSWTAAPSELKSFAAFKKRTPRYSHKRGKKRGGEKNKKGTVIPCKARLSIGGGFGVSKKRGDSPLPLRRGGKKKKIERHKKKSISTRCQKRPGDKAPYFKGKRKRRGDVTRCFHVVRRAHFP